MNDLAVRTDAANTRLQIASLVRDSLDARNASVSGVSLDEESIDLLSYQRQFQAATRYLSIIDETPSISVVSRLISSKGSTMSTPSVSVVS